MKAKSAIRLVAMNTLPKKHVPTAEEEKFLMGMDKKHQDLMNLAYEKLETSFRPEWCHYWSEVNPKPTKKTVKK